MKSSNPYYGKTIKSSNTFFNRWVGSHAIMWQLTSSLKSLDILLQNYDNSKKNLVISLADPFYIHGPVRWSNANMQIEEAEYPDFSETGFIVFDLDAGFKVLCSDVSVRENVKLR